MIHIEYTIQERAARNVKNRELLKLTAQLYIKRSFDKALTSMEAESWITIAKEQGFTEMALEMQTDLNNELLTA